MIADLVITGFKTRQYQSKGETRTAHDLFVADADANPVTRMASEMILVLGDDEYTKLGKTPEGQVLKASLKQFVEMRNGLPKVRAAVIEWPKSAK